MIFLLLVACSDKGDESNPPADDSTAPVDDSVTQFDLTLYSPDFEPAAGDPLDGECDFLLPKAFSCGNGNPEIRWENAPSDTVTFALVLDDPDADHFPHWAIYDIPSTAPGLDQGISGESVAKHTLPEGAIELENGTDRSATSGAVPRRRTCIAGDSGRSATRSTEHRRGRRQRSSSRGWRAKRAISRTTLPRRATSTIREPHRRRQRLRRQLPERVGSKGTPRVARHAPSALGGSLPTREHGAAAAPPSGVLARQLAVRLSRLLRAAAPHEGLCSSRGTVSRLPRDPGRRHRGACATRVSGEPRSARLAPEHVPRELLRKPSRRRSLGGRGPRRRASRSRARSRRLALGRRACALPVRPPPERATRRRSKPCGSPTAHSRCSAVPSGRTRSSIACSASTSRTPRSAPTSRASAPGG